MRRGRILILLALILLGIALAALFFLRRFCVTPNSWN